MFNGGGRGFTGTQINVNTRCDVFYSEKARLDVGLWNGFLSLKLAPTTGVDSRGIRQYEQDKLRILSTSIKFDKLETLLEGIHDELIPAKESNKSCRVSLMTQTTNPQGIMKKLTTVGYDADSNIYYIEFANNLNEEGIASPEQTVRFEFEKKDFILNYDISNGTSDNRTVESDFTRFMKIIEGYPRTIPMEHHGVEYNNSFSRPSNNGGGFQNYNGNAQSNNIPQNYMQPQQQYSAPVTSAEGGFDGLDLPF